MKNRRSTSPTWNTSDLFRRPKDWDKEYKALSKKINKFSKYRGYAAESIPEAREALDAYYDIHKRLERIYVYANCRYDADSDDTKNKERFSRASLLNGKFAAAASFLDPELLTLTDDQLRQYAADPELKEYSQYIHRLRRTRSNTLSKAEEGIIAAHSNASESPYRIFVSLVCSDWPHPIFTAADGTEVIANDSSFAHYRYSSNRKERRDCFTSFFGTYKKFEHTFAELISSHVQYHTVHASLKHYDNPLEYSLAGSAVDGDFYNKLLQRIHSYLPLFHRYWEVKGEHLGLAKQHYYDTYAILANSNKLYPWKSACKIASSALKPLGSDYVKKLSKGLKIESGWVDPFPRDHKWGSGYCISAYGSHPYVMLNHTDSYDSLTTLVHEYGHAMHDVYSSAEQPYPTAAVDIMTAEVASTVNEELLVLHLLDQESDPDERKYILAASLDGFRQTVFRQAVFAEFERDIYLRAVDNKALTAEYLNRQYLKILRKYYGSSVKIDPVYGIEWAFVSHFYDSFYVYQYVTGYIAATVLAQRIRDGGENEADKYIEGLLKSGSSKNPVEILWDVGIDLMDDDPYDQAMSVFEERLTELESLL